MKKTRYLIGVLMLAMLSVVVIIGTGCTSVQDLSGQPKQKKSQLAMLRVVSKSDASTTTTIASVDSTKVNSQKKFVSVLPGEHVISVNLHKVVGVIPGKRSPIKLYLNNTELTKPDEPDTVISIDSDEPQVVVARLEAGKSYYIHSFDTLRRVRRLPMNRYDQNMIDIIGDRAPFSNFGWVVIGDWSVEVWELAK